MAVYIPYCMECGNDDNPCRCKVIGPSVAFACFCIAAAIEWPVGAIIWCFKKSKGTSIMGHPAMVVYPTVKDLIPC
ncbi:hypothetical protein MPTK1_7g14620 [Marchantia polymorpha subsp. ruderalis]|uniref:Uncharacterized protein n=2 Tax=Marchantia polymorpha TaxID=3197 RepID=A0AAF6BZL7_MARPO|nr:hypothetical protein MARPO_0009s0147 [Marchantia polymorpha]BBN17451.1 hypothetical protein Mp_7g14620 [Marchantia polymorpha subsp. ruderalis]|eukprot:PTQ47057.1 hypothetical protein MARPO_0009s0147 [Marchantia polymorpha]